MNPYEPPRAEGNERNGVSIADFFTLITFGAMLGFFGACMLIEYLNPKVFPAIWWGN